MKSSISYNEKDTNIVLHKSLIIQKLSSLKLTVLLLLLLAVLVFIGTIYQTEHGLYAAQEKIFHSIFFNWGFLVLPSARTVMWLLFFNLSAALVYRFKYTWRNAGLITAHIGLLTILISSFYTFHFMQESFMSLREGERSNISEDYFRWELFILKDPLAAGEENQKLIIPQTDFKEGQIINSDIGFQIKISKYFENAVLADAPMLGKSVLVKIKKEKEPEANFPGMELQLGDTSTLDLSAAIERPVSWSNENAEYIFLLRRQKYNMPLSIELIDVSRELYSGSEIAKSYSSKVRVNNDRELSISMNKPLRHKGYTFYQSQYQVDADGNESSTLAVVKNHAFALPYIACLLMFLGLLMHFIQAFIHFIQKKELAITLLFLVNFMAFSFSPVQAAPQPAKKIDLSQFSRILSLESGRIKPLDSYARSTLLRLSGKNSLQKDTALEWLARLMFNPALAEDNRVFLINHPEVLEAIHVPVNHKRHYSFAELSPSLEKIHELAFKAAQKTEKEQSIVEKEFIRVFSNISLYIHLSNSLQAFIPRAEFSIKDDELVKELKLPNQESSLYELSSVISQLESELKSITNKNIPFEKLNPKQKETIRVTINTYSWIENYHMQQDLLGESQALKLIPNFLRVEKSNLFSNETQEIKNWQNPWGAMLAFDKQLYLSEIQSLTRAYLSNDQKNFDHSIKALNNTIKKELQAYSEEVKQIDLELFYNSFAALSKSKLFYGLSFLLVLLSFICYSTILSKISLALLSLGFLSHTLALISRILILERAPVSNLFETFVFVAWVCVSLGLVLELLNHRFNLFNNAHKITNSSLSTNETLPTNSSYNKSNNLGIILASFAGLILLLISDKFAGDTDTLQVVIAVLNSNFWLSTHVIAISTGYAGVCAAGIVGHVYLIKKLLLSSEREKLLASSAKILEVDAQVDSIKRLNTLENPILRNLYSAILGVLAFGLLFSFLGTILGGIWADQSWGRFWGWDPKENGALLIVLWSAIVFHARMAGIIKDTGLAVASIIGIIIVMLAWFGINLLGVGLHSYGFTDTALTGLLSYITAELFFIGFMLFKLRKSKNN